MTTVHGRDLRSTRTMVAITWAAAKSCLCTFWLFPSAFGRLASRLLCAQPHRLQRIIHNRGQIGLDYFEFSREHGNALREIVDYLPRPLKLLRGPALNSEVWRATAEDVDRSQPDSAGELHGRPSGGLTSALRGAKTDWPGRIQAGACRTWQRLLASYLRVRAGQIVLQVCAAWNVMAAASTSMRNSRSAGLMCLVRQMKPYSDRLPKQEQP